MKHEEEKIQESIARYLDAKKVLFCSSLGGVNLSLKVAARLKRAGYRKGFSDIFIYEPRGGYHGLGIELKAPGGKVLSHQKEWQTRLLERGYSARICPVFKTGKECHDWVIKVIDNYLAL